MDQNNRSNLYEKRVSLFAINISSCKSIKGVNILNKVESPHFSQKLTVRNIQDEDIDEIIQIAKVGFGNPEIAFKREHYESQIHIFPEGQVCIEYDGKILGSCSSLIVNFDKYGEDHSFEEISDKGFIS